MASYAGFFAAGAAESTGAQPVRMVVGVTSAQTCLVLKDRLQRLRQAGFDVTVVSSPGRLLEQTARAEGVTACGIAMEREMAPLADLRAFFQLLVLLLRIRPTVVEFSTPKAGLLGTLAAWLLGVPERVYMLRGLRLEGVEGWRRGLLLAAERLTAACATQVLCNSESLCQEAGALGIGGDKRLLLGEGSSNGVDCWHYQPDAADGRRMREELGLGATAPVVGFVGRLTCDKGIPELLDAFEQIRQRVPECRLLLVGWFDAAEDALPEPMRRAIEAHPTICLTGFVPDAAPYYHAMDLLVLPTHREGFPNVALEAAASGLPVVATEATGARDAVVSEVTGLLVPVGYPEAIAEAVVELLTDASKRLRFGAAGRRWVAEHFNREHVLGLTARFYQQAAGLRVATETVKPCTAQASVVQT